MVRPLAALALAAVAFAPLAAASCADEADPGGASATGPSNVAAALAVIPEDAIGDGSDVETVTWSDLAAAAEIAGVERPEDRADTQAVVDYVNAVTGGPTGEGESSPVAALPPQVANVTQLARGLEEFRAEVGWDLLDIDRFAEEYAPPDSVTVMAGGFDEGSLADAMGEPEGGTWALGTEGEIVMDEVSPARRLGEAMYTTTVPGGVAVTRSSDLTAEVRGLAEGDGASLADDPQLAALAEAVDGEDAYSAMLVRPGIAAGAGFEAPAGRDDLCAEALPGIPDASATAVADDDGPVILVAHAYPSGDDAAAAADRLEELVAEGTSIARRMPWNEMVTVDDVAVTGPDGTVAIARLRPTEDGRAGLWRDLVNVRDGLVAGCEE